MRYHASHCDKDEVPKDYYSHPEYYEDRREVIDWEVRGATWVEVADE
ncbi:MAG: hypothetical protein NTZ35_00605 [Ignavibacteriales bacterium]|nr:hypothetical protein [Ignavibacteriales bacterium]